MAAYKTIFITNDKGKTEKVNCYTIPEKRKKQFKILK